MKMVAFNANHHKTAKSAIMASGTDHDTYGGERAKHGFRVKGDVPCQLAQHAGLDALDGQ
jgi:hypothetical protein